MSDIEDGNPYMAPHPPTLGSAPATPAPLLGETGAR